MPKPQLLNDNTIKFFDNEMDEPQLEKNTSYKVNKKFLGVIICTVIVACTAYFGTKVYNKLPQESVVTEKVMEEALTQYLKSYFPTEEEYIKDYVEMQNGRESFMVKGTNGQPIINKRLDLNIDTANGHRERALEEMEASWKTLMKTENILLKVNEMNNQSVN